MALYDYLDLAPMRLRRLNANEPVNVAPPPPSSRGIFSSGRGATITDDGLVYEGGSWTTPSSTTSLQGAGGLLSTLGKVGTLAGVATNNPSLAQTSSNIGLIGRTIAAPTPLDAAQVLGSTAAARAGVSFPVISTINGAIDGYQREGTAEGAKWGAARGAAASVPALALGTMLGPVGGLIGGLALSGPASQMVDNIRLGDDVMPDAPTFAPFGNTVSKHQMGRAIQNDEDPLAALINALSPAQEADPDETTTGVNMTTPGAGVLSVTQSTLTAGNPTDTSSMQTQSSSWDWYDGGSGGWSTDYTSGVEGSTAATADQPDGPDGMNAGQGYVWSGDTGSGSSTNDGSGGGYDGAGGSSGYDGGATYGW